MGRHKKIQQMEQQPTDNNKMPSTVEGDILSFTLEITRVSNGYIIKSKATDGNDGIMVFNGADAHRKVSSYTFDLAMQEMKEGEVITFSSQLTYNIKK